MSGAKEIALGRSFRLLIAGGGTGGHLFPGIAVALELKRRLKEASVLFVGARARMEARILPGYGLSFTTIPIQGLKGKGWMKSLGTLLGLPRALTRAIGILRDFAPSVVLGMGGYSAGPLCVGARVLGIPSAIHEQNAYPGLTNRLLGRMVHRILISFEASASHFPRKKVLRTGNPVRQDLLELSGISPPAPPPLVVLVMGGSQGARAINSALVQALEELGPLGERLQVIHQTGDADYPRVVQEYRDRGLKGEIYPFIQDIASAYRKTHLVVSRAGATSLFELAALGKPSVLIPYPYAANNHQELNARALAGLGGAELILQRDLNGPRLAQVLRRYMNEPGALTAMGEKARLLARPDAASAIVECLLALGAR